MSPEYRGHYPLFAADGEADELRPGVLRTLSEGSWFEYDEKETPGGVAVGVVMRMVEGEQAAYEAAVEKGFVPGIVPEFVPGIVGRIREFIGRIMVEPR